MSSSIAIQSRRQEVTTINPATAFLSRALLGACIGSAVALHGYQMAGAAPAAVREHLHSVAVMAAAISLAMTAFLKVQMASIAGRTHKVKVNGQKQEVHIRRRTEVIAFLVKRWLVFLVCTAVALSLLSLGLSHYRVKLPVENVQAALAQVKQMSQDVTRLLFALALSGATLLLSETTLRLSSKAGLPYQASWIYLPAIISMSSMLTRLAGR